MNRFCTMVIFSLFVFVLAVRAEGPCDAALIKSTYNSFSSDHLDWRLATLVTRRDYEEIKHNEGANAVIYGVPVGENYEDFTKRIQEYMHTHHESLTHDQIVNILWTGLDATSGSAYRDCLNASIFVSGGLHIAAIAATKTEVSVLVSWNPTGSEPAKISPAWTWHSAGGSGLPRQITQGLTTAVIPRPTQVRTLAVNYSGFTSSLVIEPLVNLPNPPPPAPFVETTEVYTSPDNVASGACKDWGQFSTVCSPNKPEGWTIVSQSFTVIGDRPGCSMDKITCDLVAEPTSTRVCYHFKTQGHDEECGHSGNTGIHYSKGQLTVVWRHRETSK